MGVVDGAQTIYFTQKGIAEEQNPIYGRHPSPERIIATKIGFGITHYLLSKELVKKDSKLGRIFQVTTIGIQAGVVTWNAKFIF